MTPLIILFIFSLICQLVFLLFFFLRFALYRQEKVAKAVQTPVSVIVAAHNEEQNLKQLIPALLGQNYHDYEIIIVLDRCTDNSANYLDAVSEEKIKVIENKVVPPEWDPKKYALSEGIEAASAEHLLFTDADTLPASDEWITAMMSSWRTADPVILGYSGYRKRKGLLNNMVRYDTLYTAAQYFSFALNGIPYMGVGRNLGYKRSAFYGVKGFAGYEKVTGGDDDLIVQKLVTGSKASLCLDKNGFTISSPKTTWKGYFRQKVRHMKVGKKYPFPPGILLGVLNFSHLIFFFLLILGLISGQYYELLIGGVFLRTTLIISIFVYITHKLNEKLEWVLIPLLDFFYLIQWWVVGITSVISKQASWT